MWIDRYTHRYSMNFLSIVNSPRTRNINHSEEFLRTNLDEFMDSQVVPSFLTKIILTSLSRKKK